jgi:hypothetical protein
MAFCDECYEVQRWLAEDGYPDFVSNYRRHYGTWKRKLDMDCKFCRFLAIDMAKQVNDEGDWQMFCHNYSTKSSDMRRLRFRLVDMKKLEGAPLQALIHPSAQRITVIESGWIPDGFFSSHALPWSESLMANCLIPQREETAHARVLDRQNTDLEIVRKWYEFCCENHGSRLDSHCRVTSPLKVPGFKVIDCDSGKVVRHTDAPYLALSYVWGADLQNDGTGSCSLPEIVPQTIQDAISVTLQLGFSYLWVDRYCIDQTNQEEVFEQVGRMDLIYQHAEVSQALQRGIEVLHDTIKNICLFGAEMLVFIRSICPSLEFRLCL